MKNLALSLSFATGLAACVPEDTGDTVLDTQDTGTKIVDTAETGETGDSIVDTQDTQDTSTPGSCEIILTRNDSLGTVEWRVDDNKPLNSIELTTTYYDGIVTRTLQSEEEQGSVNLLPYALANHTLQLEHGSIFHITGEATLDDGTRCETEEDFNFFTSSSAALDYIPPTIEFNTEMIPAGFQESLQNIVFVRTIAMQKPGGSSSYTHHIVVHDALGTPLHIYPVDNTMIDAATATPLGYAILTSADVHNGQVFAMIDSFPYFQTAATLVMDPETGIMTSYMQTPEDNLLNHKISVRDSATTDGLVMDTLSWKITEESDANQAVEVEFTPDSSQTEIDSINVWFDPTEEINTTGYLYCNSTSPSEDWQVVTCPINYSGRGYPTDEFIVAKNFDTDERIIFVREGYTDSLLKPGYESRFSAVIELPDHPDYHEPLLSMVHDAVIWDNHLAILSLQIDSTTNQNTSTYLVDFDTTAGTSTFNCGYANDFMVHNYGNLIHTSGSPLTGMYIPNSGELRWINNSCELVGQQQAVGNWRDVISPAVLDEKWMMPATTQDFIPPNSSTTDSVDYDLSLL